MRNKTFKAKTIIISALAMTLAFGNCVYAGVAQNGSDVKFTKHLIDSENLTEVATGTKINEGKVLNMQVTYMYDDDGNLRTDWNYTRWKIYRVTNSGVTAFSDTITVTKGQYKGLTMDSKVTPSDTLLVKARGNNEKYDTKISGYLYNFNKK